MIDIINKLLAGDTLKYLLVALVVLNAGLSAVSSALELVGKAALTPAWLKPVVEVMKKIVDFLSANIKH